jgi:hypothetical protein
MGQYISRQSCVERAFMSGNIIKALTGHADLKQVSVYPPPLTKPSSQRRASRPSRGRKSEQSLSSLSKNLYERRTSNMENQQVVENNGGQGGIRTLGTLSRTHAFQACALNHSATCPSFEEAACKATRLFGADIYQGFSGDQPISDSFSTFIPKTFIQMSFARLGRSL